MRTNFLQWSFTQISTVVAIGLVSFSFCSIEAQATLQDPASKVTFPSEVSFDVAGTQHTLKATGSSTRTKFFVKVYAVANYVENPVATSKNDLYDQIIKGNGARQLTLQWLHDVDAAKVKDGFNESFHKITSPEEFTALQGSIDKFLTVFDQDMRVNDKIVLRWLPDGTVEFYRNDKNSGEVKNNQFAQTLWNIWLGQKSVVNRDQMFSLIIK